MTIIISSRQRKLEEALLYCGQFKDALEALVDWLKKVEKELSEDGPVHGDLDTVSALIDQHKVSIKKSTEKKDGKSYGIIAGNSQLFAFRLYGCQRF